MRIEIKIIVLLLLSKLVYAQNVGIGTAEPVAPLNLYHPNNSRMLIHNAFTGTTSSDGLYIGNINNIGGFLWNLENSILSFGTNNAERMVINNNGNVGIGTANPQNNLAIYNFNNASFSLQNGSTGATTNDGFKISTDLQKISLINFEPSSMSLGTNGTERVTITGSGLVGINNTNPAGILDVYASIGTALKVSGGINITGNGQSPGLGKVLTSDASGNAFWEGAIAFSANDLGTSNVSIPSGTDTKLIYTIEEFDTGNDFDLTTSEFTAPVRGIYHFDYFVYWLSHTNGSGYVSVTIRKNGSIHSTARLPAVASGEISNTISINMLLNAGDKITPYVYQTSGVNQSVGQDGRQVKFSGYLVCRQ